MGADVELYLQENFSVTHDSGGTHFTELLLKRFMGREPLEIISAGVYPDYVLVCVDPNSTDRKTSSEMAVIAIAHTQVHGFMVRNYYYHTQISLP